MLKDNYNTLALQVSEGRLTIQRSRFLSFAYKVTSVNEAMAIVTEMRSKTYFDARHVCYAFRLGVEGEISKSDDNGEPSGTAGKPILGRILSLGLSDVLVIVVRYFGGIKLGTSGLIKAYGESAELALVAGGVQQVILYDTITVAYEPNLTGTVMNLINKSGGAIAEMGYNTGLSTVEFIIRKGESEKILEKLNSIFGVSAKKVLPLQSQLGNT